MARLTEQLHVAWESLSGAREGSGWRTIAIGSKGNCSLEAGRRFPDNAEALLVGFQTARLPQGEKLPDGQGFEVAQVDPHEDGKTWLALNRRDPGSLDMFTAMAGDVCDALEGETEARSELRLMAVLLGRVRAWQEFMRKGATILSPEAEIGLVGELLVLDALISAGLPIVSAVSAWVGPLDAVQDFQIGTGAIEVKSTVSSTGFLARIGSLEQLDDSIRQPIFVVGQRLCQDSGGRSLPEYVEQVRSTVAGDPEARRLFAERLLSAGFWASHADRYRRRFEPTGARVIPVGEGFPRLVPGSVPAGVTRATYEINLDAVNGTNLAFGAVLSALGAI